MSFKACVSLFIFILDDQFFGESGVLKSPTIIVLLSISPFMAVSTRYQLQEKNCKKYKHMEVKQYTTK